MFELLLWRETYFYFIFIHQRRTRAFLDKHVWFFKKFYSSLKCLTLSLILFVKLSDMHCSNLWINDSNLLPEYVLNIYFSLVRVFATSSNLRLCVLRCRTTVKPTRWPTATWLWCLAPTCCGDKTTPWRWAPSGRSTTSPGPCWISIIWFFLEFHPVALLSLFTCETWMHGQHLALSSIITVLLFQQHTWTYCGPVCCTSC